MKTIKCVVIDCTKIHNIPNKTYTGDIIEIDIPLAYLPNVDKRQFEKPVPYYYNTIPKQNENSELDIILNDGLTCEKYWEIIDYYRDVKHSTEHSLVMIAGGKKLSWDIDEVIDQKSISISSGYYQDNNKPQGGNTIPERNINVKATFINKWHRVNGNAIFYLYDGNKPINTTRAIFMKCIYQVARIHGVKTLSYSNIMFASQDAEKKIEIMNDIRELEGKILPLASRSVIKENANKFIYISSSTEISDEPTINVEEINIDIIKHLRSNLNELYCRLYCDSLIVGELIDILGGNTILERNNRKDLADKLYKKMILKGFGEDEIRRGPFFDIELKESGYDKAVKLKHQEERKKIALNFLEYLTSNHYVTLEDAYIVMSAQINDQYVINGDPFYQAGPWFHPISEYENFILTLSHGVEAKINTVSQTDYMYEKSKNIIWCDLFRRYDSIYKDR